jgi:hypothetical protein
MPDQLGRVAESIGFKPRQARRRFAMIRSILQNRFRLTVLTIGFALCVTAGWATPARADVLPPGAAKAAGYLDTRQAGVDVLSFVHYGATYRGHRMISVLGVTGRSADTCLIYEFRWEDDGWTQVHFYCDGNGKVYAVQAGRTNAVLQEPWAMAKLAIQVIGRFLVEAVANDPQAKAEAIRKIDAADVQGMCLDYVRARQR